MFKSLATIAALLTPSASAQAAPQEEDHWAVIVAGSAGYWNYRHQADSCHAYQIMKKNGIPEDKIIHVAYDDIADNGENVWPGQIFNKPDPGGPGVNVYKGCKIDYRQNEASHDNILNILKGDSKATKGKKVLKSTENSKIFFYYADHGAPHLVEAPVGKVITSKELNDTFKYMKENKMFKEMVFYLEACESGSMFDTLDDNMGIYALSASNERESSWGTYCSPNDEVNGYSMDTCLGDLFSVNWMEDADKNKGRLDHETIKEQFERVKELTNRSHVLEFGQKSISKEKIGDYISNKEYDDASWFLSSKLLDFYKSEKVDVEELKNIQLKQDSAVDSRDIKLHHLYSKMIRNPTEQAHQALKDELNSRNKIEHIFKQAFSEHMETLKNKTYPLAKTPEHFDCYQALINAFESKCGKSEYSKKFFGAFLSECKTTNYKLDSIERLDKACTEEQTLNLF